MSKKMPNQEAIEETVKRLVSVVRYARLKQSIFAIAPEPELNFWRLIMAAMTDIAVIDWCIIFGADSQEAHWKKIVPFAEHEGFRKGLFKFADINEMDWASYRNELKDYRDKHVAHLGERKTTDIYPRFDKAISSAEFYYAWLLEKKLISSSLPQSLKEYGEKFSSLSDEIAMAAINATKGIKERVL